MKFLMTIFVSLTLQVAIAQPNIIMPTEITKITQTEKNIQWDKVSAISGFVGLVLAFTPYLSIIGIGLCFFALGIGLFARRKKQRKLWYRIGIICGSLGVVALLGVIGLMTFF